MERIGRRTFLGVVATGLAGIVLGGRVQRALTGLTFGGELSPLGRFRIYSVTPEMPRRTASDYRLDVRGLVGRPLTLTLDDLFALPRTEMTKDFQCVTGWRVEDVAWAGVLLRDVLDLAGVERDASAVTFVSFDGAYKESLTLEQARRDDVLVAYEMLGGPVLREHGGPARLYVAPMYGYKSCKWLGAIEVTRRLEPGYWEVRGYDQHAWIGRSNGRDDEPV